MSLTRALDRVIDELDRPVQPIPLARHRKRTRMAGRRLTLTPRGRRYLALLHSTDDALIVLGTLYARLGYIEPRPDYLYDRRAVVEAIVLAEFGPVLTLIEGAA